MNRRRIFSLALCVGLCAISVTILLFVVGDPVRAQNSTRYVATSGTDSGDCINPSHPCRTLQYAVDRADANDVIKMAAGVYADINHYGGLAQVVYVPDSITIRGGYTVDFVEPPKPDTNLTVLDAQGGGRVVYVASHGITVTIEGVHIARGNATYLGGGSWGEDCGGGVYAGNSSVFIGHSKIYSSTAYKGAGVAAIGSQLSMHDNQIFSNTTSYGGGLFLNHGSASLINNTVSTNSAKVNGGGMYILRGRAELIGNIISANTSWYGGGLFLEESSASFSGNTIHASKADGTGPGGGLYAQECTLSLHQNVISENTASGGGGLMLVWNQELLSGNRIQGNTAFLAGGGLASHSSDTTLINNVVADNQASSGSGLYLAETSLRLLHTTIARNGFGEHPDETKGDGVGIYIAPWSGHRPPSQVFMTNTILVSHSVGITVAAGSTATLEATLWGSGTWANDTDWGGDGVIITGSVNYWGDPAFRHPKWGDYHITEYSAAKDAGVNAGVNTDIDGQVRPYDLGYDIGADEFHPYLYRYLPAVMRNGTNCIAAGDLRHWFEGEQCCAGLSEIDITQPCDRPGVGGCKPDGCFVIPPCACSVCAPCGDGVCQSEFRENPCSCPEDCM